jgi:hypothetical protein
MSAEKIPAGSLMETVVAGDYCVGYGACSLGQFVVDEPRSVCPLPAGPRRALAAPSDEFAAACPFSSASVSEDEIAAAAFPNTSRSFDEVGHCLRITAAHGFRSRGSSGGFGWWPPAELLFRGPWDHRPLRAARRTPVRHDWTPSCRKFMALARQWTSKPS